MNRKVFRSSLALLACITLGGTILPSVNADTPVFHVRHIHYHAHRHYVTKEFKNKRLVKKQAHYQENKRFMRKFRKELARVIRRNRKAVMHEHVAKDNHSYTNTRWFKDGLSARNLRARNWVSWHESSHRWNVLSYGGVCIGYFQLDPGYLGYHHGHVNLNHKHQVQIADAYVKIRYGSWVNAQKFWEAHQWY